MSNLDISKVNNLFNNAVDRHQEHSSSVNNVIEIPINKIKFNRFQNRKKLNNLDELATSIKLNGIIQPLIVNADDPSSKKPYELINGERRLLAAKKAGLAKVPVIIRNLNDKQIINFTLAENLQREDLTPVEIAKGYQMWLDINQGTYEQLAKVMGKSLGTIGSYMKIVKMDNLLKDALQTCDINLKQALEIDKLIDKSKLSETIQIVINNNLTIKETAELIKKINNDKKTHVKHNEIANKINSKIARDYQERLTSKYGKGRFKITQKNSNKMGKIEIKFKNDDELNEWFCLINSWNDNTHNH